MMSAVDIFTNAGDKGESYEIYVDYRGYFATLRFFLFRPGGTDEVHLLRIYKRARVWAY